MTYHHIGGNFAGPYSPCADPETNEDTLREYVAQHSLFMWDNVMYHCEYTNGI